MEPVAARPALCAGAIKNAQARFPVRKSGVTILAYHLVDGGTGLAVDLPARVFREQLDVISSASKVVSLNAALAMLRAGSLPAERLTVLTFDDACRNFYERVMPIIYDYSMEATLYVPVGFINGTSGSPFKYLPPPGPLPMTWPQLEEVTQSGRVTIGSHTCTHQDLRRMRPDRLESELLGSRIELEERLRAPVDSFSYPASLVSKDVVAAARRWYDSAVLGGGTVIRPQRWDPHRLPRVSVRSDLTNKDIEALLSRSVWLEERVRHFMRGFRGY